MNNEPVAWMSNEKEFYVQKNYCPDFIPLYTHPADEKQSKFKPNNQVNFELTDEETTEVIRKIANNNEYVYSLYEDFEGIEFSRVGIYELCRAILRKASEK